MSSNQQSPLASQIKEAQEILAALQLKKLERQKSEEVHGISGTFAQPSTAPPPLGKMPSIRRTGSSRRGDLFCPTQFFSASQVGIDGPTSSSSMGRISGDGFSLDQPPRTGFMRAATLPANTVFDYNPPEMASFQLPIHYETAGLSQGRVSYSSSEQSSAEKLMNSTQPRMQRSSTLPTHRDMNFFPHPYQTGSHRSPRVSHLGVVSESFSELMDDDMPTVRKNDFLDTR